MKQPPSDSFYRRRPLNPSTSQQLSILFKNIGILLFGIGIGSIGTSWLMPKTNSPISAQPPQRLLNSPSFAESDSSKSEAQNKAEANNEQPSVQMDDVANATVCVKTMMGASRQACASGVSIDPQVAGIDPTRGAVVLTNYHVIADMGNRPPLQLNGKGKVFNAEIIRQSPEFDLALLLVPQADFPIAALAEASPEQGTAVRAIGFPNNQPLTIKDSSLLGKTQNCLAVAPCLAIRQGTITFGNSGGPLEANGAVIGITQGEIVDEIAIPVEQIRQFLSGQLPSVQRSTPRFGSHFPMREPPYYPPSMGEPPPYGAW